MFVLLVLSFTCVRQSLSARGEHKVDEHKVDEHKVDEHKVDEHKVRPYMTLFFFHLVDTG